MQHPHSAYYLLGALPAVFLHKRLAVVEDPLQFVRPENDIHSVKSNTHYVTGKAVLLHSEAPPILPSTEAFTAQHCRKQCLRPRMANAAFDKVG